jgi:hypothetical protein
MKTINGKNSKGFDQILPKILVHGQEQLIASLMVLFKLIYERKFIFCQWPVAKTVPKFKYMGE